MNGVGVDEAVAALRARQPGLWINPARGPAAAGLASSPVPAARVADAQARLRRAAPALAQLFPALRAQQGEIRSRLLEVPALGTELLAGRGGRVLLKADHELPVAGSVKARGGFHEVLEFAESLVQKHGLPAAGVDGLALVSEEARALFGRCRVAVGSTGNLGMSIGLMAAALGFEAVVHMSVEAKAWKKARLRGAGVRVVEHEGDYEAAVAAGRQEAAGDPLAYFVDDERSPSLFAGYAAAGAETAAQLAGLGVSVDADHPLFVYLPCGVGGAPAGIAYGLKLQYGDHVHCFFAEPVAFPCFTLGILAGGAEAPSVYELGLGQATQADGLAVPRASQLALDTMRPLLSGSFTVADETLLAHLSLAQEREGLKIEPSAAAGFSGPAMVLGTAGGARYLQEERLEARLARATHLLWTTGGALLPDEAYADMLARGREVRSTSTGK